MLSQVFAAILFGIPEQTLSSSGLPATYRPYPKLHATSAISSPTSYSTPEYPRWKTVIANGQASTAAFRVQPDPDCHYDIEYADLAKRGDDPKELASMLRDEYLPAATLTERDGIIDGRNVDPYPPMKQTVRTFSEFGYTTTATYFEAIPITTWFPEVEARSTADVRERDLTTEFGHNFEPTGFTTEDVWTVISDGHTAYRTSGVAVTADATHFDVSVFPLSSTSMKTSTKTSIPSSTVSTKWTTTTASPKTSWTTVTSSPAARSTLTTIFDITDVRHATIVYDEEVVTRTTTGGGVTKTLTETLVHFPALPPVPPMTTGSTMPALPPMPPMTRTIGNTDEEIRKTTSTIFVHAPSSAVAHVATIHNVSRIFSTSDRVLDIEATKHVTKSISGSAKSTETRVGNTASAVFSAVGRRTLLAVVTFMTSVCFLPGSV